MSEATPTPDAGRRRRPEVYLAVAALALAALAVFGEPFGGGGVVTLDLKELANIVEGEVDHVTAEELADWIIQQSPEYRLIDLRDPASYAEYHIPTAENVSLPDLPDYPLWRNERIVLYSGGGIHSAQGWFLLKAKGYQGVYFLLGGLDAWQDEVLFPAPPPETDAAARARFARTAEVSRFFGGTPRESAAGAELSASRALPEVEPPAPLPVRAAKKKKRKEGC